MNPALGLAVGRLAFGCGAIAAPALVTRGFRLSPETNRQLPYVMRLFGSREIAIGAMTLLASGKTQRNLILVGVAIDAADSYSAVMSTKEGAVDRSTGMYLTVPALGAVAVGLVGAFKKSKG